MFGSQTFCSRSKFMFESQTYMLIIKKNSNLHPGSLFSISLIVFKTSYAKYIIFPGISIENLNKMIPIMIHKSICILV